MRLVKRVPWDSGKIIPASTALEFLAQIATRDKHILAGDAGPDVLGDDLSHSPGSTSQGVVVDASVGIVTWVASAWSSRGCGYVACPCVGGRG